MNLCNRWRLALLGALSFSLGSCSSSKPEGAVDDSRDPAQAQLGTNHSPLMSELYGGHCTPDGKVCAHFAPTEMPIHAIRDYLKGAKRRIRMMSYSLNVLDYVDIIQSKVARGVEVDIVNDYKNSDPPSDEMRMFKRRPSQKLTSYRIPNLRGRSPQMHNKVFVIDDEFVIFGSANFTYNGLVANYENMMMVRDRGLVARFNDEIDEMMAASQAACELFYNKPADCGTGHERNEGWDPDFHLYARCGNSAIALPSYNQATRQWQAPTPASIARENADIQDAYCKIPFERRIKVKWEGPCFGTRFGLFNSGNQPTVSDLGACFENPAQGAKWGQLAERMKGIERYVRDSDTHPGALVSSDPPTEKPPYRRQSRQTGEFRVWFSPEDDAEKALVDSLLEAAQSPGDSAVLVSTNFVTNKSIADALVSLNQKRTKYLEVFFDRGRWVDPNFKNQRPRLEPFVTQFDNQLTGSYSSNHNKMAVVYTPKNGLVLLNGSANWSGGAMNNNDENFAIITHEETALIYLKEILSHLSVYKYGHNVNDPKFRAMLDWLVSRPKINGQCLKALLAWKNPDGSRVTECRTSRGQIWKPRQMAPAVIGIRDVPFSREQNRLWVWVPQLSNNKGAFIEAYNGGDSFSGKWVTSVPLPPGWDFQFKFFRGPRHLIPRPGDFNGLTPEYGGFNDRRQRTSDLALHTIYDAHIKWGEEPRR